MKYLIVRGRDAAQRGKNVAKRKSSAAFSQIRSRIWPTLKQILLFGVLVGYAFAGAVLFHYLEGPPEQERIVQRINDTAALRQTYLEELANATIDCNGTGIDCAELFENATLRYEAALEETLGFHIDLMQSEAYRWTFWNAFYYSFTIFTTIGYGNITCQTKWGRIATILYALFGIPLVLTLLKYIGQSLFQRSSWVWRKLRRLGKWCIRCFRRNVLRHKDLKITRQASISTQGSIDDEDLESGFPLFLAISIVLIYIFAVAYAFALYEGGWDFLDAFYFFFITLSTIGLGDQSPNESNDGITYIVGFILVLIGLALVSMCITVLQNRVEQTYLKTFLKMQNRFLVGSIEDLNEAEMDEATGRLSRMGSAALGVLRVSQVSQARRSRSSRGSTRVFEDEDGGQVVIVPLRHGSVISRVDTDDDGQNPSPSKVRFSDIPEESDHNTLQLPGAKPVRQPSI